MIGGVIYVKGNASNYIGSSYLGAKQGMKGGEIIIDGNAGDYLGSFMRRGLIVVKEKCWKVLLLQNDCWECNFI